MDKRGLDNKAIRYDNMVRDRLDDELGLFEKYDEILGEIRKRIIEKGAKSVLDMGCGTGNLCGEISGEIEVVGVDQSLEMLLQAKKKYNSMKLRLGNFLNESFSKDEFDVVVTTFAFHVLDEEQKKVALKNMIDFAKEDGRIIIGDFMVQNGSEREKYRRELCDAKRYDLWNVIDRRYYTDLESLVDYVRSLGLKIAYQHIVNFSWIVEIEK